MIRIVLLFMLLASPTQAQVCLCPQCMLGPYDRYTIASGAMKPALEPGDCLIVRTDFRPEDLWPGRIVVFLERPGNFVHVFRMVATGGQTVQMRGGRLWIDGAEVPQEPREPYRQIMQSEGQFGSMPRCPQPTAVGETCDIAQAQETLPGITYGVLDLGSGQLDDTGEFVVPDGHVFVLGDNRDNASDSRIPRERGGRGFVAIADIMGIYDEVR